MNTKLNWEAPKVIVLVNDETNAGTVGGQAEGGHFGESAGTVS